LEVNPSSTLIVYVFYWSVVIYPSPQSLIAQGHYATAEIQSRLLGLGEEHTRLHKTWQQRQDLFSQCYDLQVFLRDAEQRDAWISTQEAFLANEDLGVSYIHVHCSHMITDYYY